MAQRHTWLQVNDDSRHLWPLQEVRPLGERLLRGVSPTDAVHVLAQFDVAPVCMGHTLCWEGEVADSIWLLQV